MYDSGISAAELIDEVREEADISAAIPLSAYVRWLNSAEQLLCSEYIKEEKTVTVTAQDGIISLVDIAAAAGEDGVCSDDVTALYGDGREIIWTTAESAYVFSGGGENYYVKSGDSLILYLTDEIQQFTVVYTVRPAAKYISGNTAAGGNICLPPEFTEIVASKLRGESYKLSNEDALAAKWLETYNSLLDDFAAYLARRRSGRYGG